MPEQYGYLRTVFRYWLCSHQLLTFIISFATAATFLTAIPVSVFPQNKPMNTASIEELKINIRDAAQRIQTISCDFIQEKEMSMIKEKIVSTGKFYFKKEKMLRWEYLQPFTYQIIIINDQISINDENKVNRFNVQSNKIFQEINHIILGSIGEHWLAMRRISMLYFQTMVQPGW